MRCLPNTRRAISAIALACLALPIQAARDVNGGLIHATGGDTPVDVPETYYTQLHPCPRSCTEKKTPREWELYSSVERLQHCDQPMLVDFAVFNPLDDPKTGVMLKACTLGNNANTTVNALFKPAKAPATISTKFRRRNEPSSECLKFGNETKADFELQRSGDTVASAGDSLLAILQGAEQAVQDAAFCGRSMLFGYSNGTAMGLYLSNSVGKATVASAIDGLIHEIKENGGSAAMTAQLCQGINGRDNNQGVVGVSIHAEGAKSLAAVQKDVASWAQGNCSSDLGGSKSKLTGVSVWENGSGILGNTTITNGTMVSRRVLHELHRRGDCTTATVQGGDSCGSMATKCGISGADFMKYNPADNFCSTLMPNQKVCCSAGTIPTPKQYDNGTCFTYFVQGGDTCSSIALSNGLTPANIEKFNDGKTWAWIDCPSLQAGINICLSDGTPPLPAPYANAVCGPVMPGTAWPTAGTNISELNPCPLNVCCNIWGNCGITSDFCTVYKSPNGNPGYSPLGKNGCVNNCGQDIVNNDVAPAAYQRIGYWESWNLDRPCANLEVANANTDGTYTHIHWAFGTLDSSFKPSINDTYKQWDSFLKLSNVKRIISFGGWGYSTSADTYNVLRDAMSPDNRDTFVTNIVNFLNDNILDGVDFDWEYPGAPDSIEGIPPGLETDGPNYLKFLISLRRKLPAGMSLSIAAPASYWYLKAFPIELMSDSLDYIVYMTYDLHGQWDAGNQYSIDGCPAGNCLRSHVNLTETELALSMITKAGVPSNKIFVGESSYGRSFGMADPTCSGPMCAFTGDRDHSTAEEGVCTGTAGYISNGEIYTLLDTADNAKTWYDTDSNSDIMTWNNGQWVAFMSPSTRSSRRGFWQSLNFAGTIDWAVDLQSFDTDFDPTTQDDDTDYLPPGDIGWGDCASATYASLEAMNADGSIPDHCTAQYLLQFLQANLTASMTAYDDLMKNGYDGKFDTYSGAVVGGASKQVDTFIRDNGNKYFTCVVSEEGLCCDKCSQQGDGLAGSCTYCFDGDCCKSPTKKLKRDRPPPPTNGCGVLECAMLLPSSLAISSEINTVFQNVSEPCPPDYSKRGLGQGDPIVDTVYWTLPPQNADQFFADIYSETGISQDNLAPTDINHSECAPSDTWAECRQQNWDIGIYGPKNYGKDDVLNPKDTVSKAYNSLTDLRGDGFDDAISQVTTGDYEGDPYDLVDALSLPIFMISDAIDGMNQVVDVANEIDHEKMMAIIFGFLSAIFFFIPIAGEIAGEVAALAGISRIAALIGAAGDSAMDIYNVVNNKGNAPLEIFSLITAPLAIMDIAAIAKAASIRRAMSADDVKGLGKVKDKLDIVDDIKSKGATCSLPAKRELQVDALLHGESRDLLMAGIMGTM
ncbi:hypothetical protein GQ53DRAFT_851577 [Thozetella sp. PMI_491]|nr:hypothetical protein GQ53DRAFT_851577 [Thozetella sp. PMI_491]